MEALERAELIANIRHQLQVSDTLSPIVIGIQSRLFDSRSLSEPKMVKSIMQHMNNQKTPTQEARCLYHVLKHLCKFFPGSKQGLVIDSSTSKFITVIEKVIKCQAELEPHIAEHIKEGDVNPYMENLFLGLISWTQILDLDFLKRCLNVLHIQESAINQVMAELYGIVESKERYFLDQDVFIGLMSILKPHIEGLGGFLKSQVEWNGKSH